VVAGAVASALEPAALGDVEDHGVCGADQLISQVPPDPREGLLGAPARDLDRQPVRVESLVIEVHVNLRRADGR
jgi:hypothetical protein